MEKGVCIRYILEPRCDQSRMKRSTLHPLESGIGAVLSCTQDLPGGEGGVVVVDSMVVDDTGADEGSELDNDDK